MRHSPFSDPPTSSSGPATWSTNELAQRAHVLPQTIRKQYSQTGTYLGVRPIKLKNNRLLWPANAIELLQSMVSKEQL